MYKTKQEISAGAVVFDFVNSLPKIVIYSRKNATQWCLPKGKIEKNETAVQAALREVQEETGLRGKIIGHLDDIYYQYQDEKRKLLVKKTVHFFLMKKEAEISKQYDPEVESLAWLTIEQALEKLSFESERMVVSKAGQLISKKKDMSDS
jgi:8-oxo-dGTP pyrophosphatase MutT (NUDIX family)